MYFAYGEREIAHLKKRDKTLAAVIDAIGPVRRRITPDLFTALAYSIVSQQISTKGAETVCRRLEETIGILTPQALDEADVSVIQQCGMSTRKAVYIKDLAREVRSGALDLNALHTMTDEEVCRRLSALRGIGVWTAEMLMTFCMQRPDVMSFDDLAIHRGLRMVYRHTAITRERFEKYRKRYSPYASVACLYIWAVAGGALEGVTDPASRGRGKSPARTRTISGKTA